MSDHISYCYDLNHINLTRVTSFKSFGKLIPYGKQTIMYLKIEPATDITMYVVKKKHFFKIFYSKTNSAVFLENLKFIFDTSSSTVTSEHTTVCDISIYPYTKGYYSIYIIQN